MSSSSESATESPIIDSTIIESATNSTSLNWASEWFGYIALCMFSMVLVVPTLGIFGLMIWEYFSDEAERKAERKKEIDEAMEQHFGGGTIDDKKLRKRKKRLERLQKQQQQQQQQQEQKEDTNNNNNNNRTANHTSSSADQFDDIRIDDINDDDTPMNTNDYDNFDADLFDDDSDTDTDSETENLNDVDSVLKQAECLLHRRKRPIRTTDNNDTDAANKFDEILT
ncbi:hypothetical protein DERF_009665 [Dermatophagoides farinae]|uniref:Uncharacterized protein n=1 Tax=Dermatophagoides farinae TaxID=6954 RepID=A0A922L485_DERFA|nr:hypothetical protein DERF_009665 [Dermatophagoides farinae]